MSMTTCRARSISRPAATRPIRNVRIEGNKVRFVFGLPKGEVDVDVEFEGTVRGDRLTGVCASSGFKFDLNGVRS